MLRVQRLLLSALCGIGIGLVATASPAIASTNCCFEVAVNVRQTASLDYGNELPQPYHGDYQLNRYWSVRSIVAFHETFIRHRPSLIDKGSEARLATIEVSNLSERHARIDSNGTYSYPYEPIPCKGIADPQERFVQEAFDSQPAPVSGAVSLPKTSNGYRLRFDVHSLFESQPPLCGGRSDLALHPKQGADQAVMSVPPPSRRFLRSADAPDQHVTHHFDFPTISITHGGVAGVHTFSNIGEARARLSWFPEPRLEAERRQLRELKCHERYCKSDHWGE